ncbi:unnamed protein product [Calicophoron daubneyi]|uniref:Pellino n=1 Tax=Calicophoron daubneyi TaxID=300641 RepID=A0AAV2T9Y6_CALDB
MMEGLLYGELAIIGFNGKSRKSSSSPRRQSKISLYKRPLANAVRPGPVKRVTDANDACAFRSPAKHAVSYTLSRHEAVVVEYIPDPEMDMFQIGRSTNNHIDFVVTEPRSVHPNHQHTPPRSNDRGGRRGEPTPRTPEREPPNNPPNKNMAKCEAPHKGFSGQESAVSRFACRIYIERRPPHTARIYAAGFDASKNIFLGELAVKWTSAGQMDGLTTNGVMILHVDPEEVLSRSPSSDKLTPVKGTPTRRTVEDDGRVFEYIALRMDMYFSGTPNLCKHCHNAGPPTESNAARMSRNTTTVGLRSPCSDWREVSICGSVYQMRKRRCVPTQANLVNEDNILHDKTLIDLCGVTLFWRSGTGLRKTANPEDLEIMIDGLNQAHFQCPILYRTLRLPSFSQLDMVAPPKFSPDNDSMMSVSKPYVYLNCGHVYGWHTWRADGDINDSYRTCPLCLQSSRFVPLQMGLEPAFYIDRALATHCFNPCGHMASEKTVRYWCSIRLPNNHNFDLHARCPFCLTSIHSKPVRLRFNGDVDEDTLVALLNALLTDNRPTSPTVSTPETSDDAEVPPLQQTEHPQPPKPVLAPQTQQQQQHNPPLIS